MNNLQQTDDMVVAENTKHYYAGTVDSKRPKKKKGCKKKSK